MRADLPLAFPLAGLAGLAGLAVLETPDADRMLAADVGEGMFLGVFVL
jgi:hypothetical protein